MRNATPALLAAVTLTACVTYTSAPPNSASLAAIKTIAVVPARPPERLILVPHAPSGRSSKEEKTPDRLPLPSKPSEGQLGAAAAVALLGGAIVKWRSSSGQLSERLAPSETGIAAAWNDSLIHELRARGFDVVELSAESAPRWPQECPSVPSEVDAIVGVELVAGFIGSDNLKPMVGAGVRVTSMECKRTMFSPMYFYGPGSPALKTDHPNMFLPSDPGMEFKDENDLFASLPRAANALRTGASTLAAHFVRQLRR